MVGLFKCTHLKLCLHKKNWAIVHSNKWKKDVLGNNFVLIQVLSAMWLWKWLNQQPSIDGFISPNSSTSCTFPPPVHPPPSPPGPAIELPLAFSLLTHICVMSCHVRYVDLLVCNVWEYVFALLKESFTVAYCRPNYVLKLKADWILDTNSSK